MDLFFHLTRQFSHPWSVCSLQLFAELHYPGDQVCVSAQRPAPGRSGKSARPDRLFRALLQHSDLGPQRHAGCGGLEYGAADFAGTAKGGLLRGGGVGTAVYERDALHFDLQLDAVLHGDVQLAAAHRGAACVQSRGDCDLARGMHDCDRER